MIRRYLSLAIVVLSGCTSVSVVPLDASYKVKRICIRENPKVIVDDFVPVVTDGLKRHGIVSEFIASTLDKQKLQDEDAEGSDQYYMEITPAPDTCDFSLTYTARRSWDMAVYLSTALISISDKTRIIASADYHLINKGGLSLYKFASVKSKIDPVMDELLKNYGANTAVNEPPPYKTTPAKATTENPTQKIAPNPPKAIPPKLDVHPAPVAVPIKEKGYSHIEKPAQKPTLNQPKAVPPPVITPNLPKQSFQELYPSPTTNEVTEKSFIIFYPELQ